MIGYGTQELTPVEYSEAGLITGIATRSLIQPLDVLKIRFQVCNQFRLYSELLFFKQVI